MPLQENQPFDDSRIVSLGASESQVQQEVHIYTEETSNGNIIATTSIPIVKQEEELLILSIEQPLSEALPIEPSIVFQNF